MTPQQKNFCSWCLNHGFRILYNFLHRQQCKYYRCRCFQCDGTGELLKAGAKQRQAAKQQQYEESVNLTKKQRRRQNVMKRKVLIKAPAEISHEPESGRKEQPWQKDSSQTLPSTSYDKPFCGFCKNHGFSFYNIGHHFKSCKYRACGCNNCKALRGITTTQNNAAHVTSKRRHSSQEDEIDRPSGSSKRLQVSSPEEQLPNCPLCLNHGFKFPVKAHHADYCMFTNCDCDPCQIQHKTAKEKVTEIVADSQPQPCSPDPPLPPTEMSKKPCAVVAPKPRVSTKTNNTSSEHQPICDYEKTNNGSEENTSSYIETSVEKNVQLPSSSTSSLAAQKNENLQTLESSSPEKEGNSAKDKSEELPNNECADMDEVESSQETSSSSLYSEIVGMPEVLDDDYRTVSEASQSSSEENYLVEREKEDCCTINSQEENMAVVVSESAQKPTTIENWSKEDTSTPTETCSNVAEFRDNQKEETAKEASLKNIKSAKVADDVAEQMVEKALSKTDNLISSASRVPEHESISENCTIAIISRPVETVSSNVKENSENSNNSTAIKPRSEEDNKLSTVENCPEEDRDSSTIENFSREEKSLTAENCPEENHDSPTIENFSQEEKSPTAENCPEENHGSSTIENYSQEDKSATVQNSSQDNRNNIAEPSTEEAPFENNHLIPSVSKVAGHHKSNVENCTTAPSSRSECTASSNTKEDLQNTIKNSSKENSAPTIKNCFKEGKPNTTGKGSSEDNSPTVGNCSSEDNSPTVGNCSSEDNSPTVGNCSSEDNSPTVGNCSSEDNSPTVGNCSSEDNSPTDENCSKGDKSSLILAKDKYKVSKLIAEEATSKKNVVTRISEVPEKQSIVEKSPASSILGSVLTTINNTEDSPLTPMLSTKAGNSKDSESQQISRQDISLAKAATSANLINDEKKGSESKTGDQVLFSTSNPTKKAPQDIMDLIADITNFNKTAENALPFTRSLSIHGSTDLDTSLFDKTHSKEKTLDVSLQLQKSLSNLHFSHAQDLNDSQNEVQPKKDCGVKKSTKGMADVLTPACAEEELEREAEDKPLEEGTNPDEATKTSAPLTPENGEVNGGKNCDLCKKKFYAPSSFRIHQYLKHNVDCESTPGIMYPCRQCSYENESEIATMDHESSHMSLIPLGRMLKLFCAIRDANSKIQN